ncbi:hypothetical protein GHT09_018203 [Marmota monax]|uniref:Homeobox domain-containing protein n=1 Tax=Marmota monax TaxID=9995 RepID=A0A834PQN9_MARMO|nr:hypothetical protein GHT09_018203 [Marmota monax]
MEEKKEKRVMEKEMMLEEEELEEEMEVEEEMEEVEEEEMEVEVVEKMEMEEEEMEVKEENEEQEQQKERALQPKKQRLVFTDLQRRTLIAIFKENKRPSKEMQVTISQQLGLELNTVSNFFMNARRRCMNRWAEEPGAAPGGPAGAAATFSKA